MTKTQQTSSDTMSVDKYYVERQAKWVKEVGLKVGDKVMLVGDPDPWRMKRGLGFHVELQLPRGGVSKVASINPELIGVMAIAEDGTYHGANYFPFYVLLKINE